MGIRKLVREAANTTLFSVSQSKLKQFRRCKRAYKYKYVDKLLRRKTKRPLMAGRIIHEMLEAYTNHQDPMTVLDKVELEKGKYFAAEAEQYGNLLEDLRYIMTAYFDYWGDDLIYLRRQGKWSEHEFEIQVGEVVFKGRIDSVASSKKLKWLVEHKSHAKRPDDDQRWRNLQSAVYVRALDILGWPVDGTLWDYISTKSPTRPEILKSGKLSSRSIITLPQVARDVITSNGLSLSEYGDYIKSQEENFKVYFDRVYTPVPSHLVDNIWTDFMDTANEMKNYKGIYPKSIDLHCGYCDYQNICRAELQNQDVDWVKEHEYTKDKGEVDAEIEE